MSTLAAQTLLAAALRSGCVTPAPERRELHVGVLAFLGRVRVEPFRRATREGANLAVQETDAAGRVLIGNARSKDIADYADVGDAAHQATSPAKSFLARTDIDDITGPLRLASNEDADVPAIVLRFDRTRMQVMRAVAS